MKKINIFLLLLSFGIVFVSGCLKHHKTSKKQHISQAESPTTINNADVKNEIPTITVWIHGTRLITKFVLQELFYSPPGMTHFSNIEKKYHMYRIAKLLESKDQNRFKTDNFYTYGWSGKLCFESREEAARDLYNELKIVIDYYKKHYDVIPRIRLITHSHGGNVALNLAKVKEIAMPFTISELILLACPVQEETKQYIADPIFERVYSLFSRGDILQVLDPQGLYKQTKKYNNQPLFSKRIFPSHKKLSQAKIKMYGRSILHAEFIFTHIVSRLPAILDALNEQQHRYLQSQKEYPILLINIKGHRLYKKDAAPGLFKTC